MFAYIKRYIYISVMKSKRTYFTLKEMVSFGEYLLSEVREQRYKQNSIENTGIAPYEDRFRNVSHADIENWKDIK